LHRSTCVGHTYPIPAHAQTGPMPSRSSPVQVPRSLPGRQRQQPILFCRCHPAARAGGQWSASLDCLFAAFIFRCLRLWRQGPRGDHACASRVGWNARRSTGDGRTAYRWRACVPHAALCPCFYFSVIPQDPPLSLDFTVCMCCGSFFFPGMWPPRDPLSFLLIYTGVIQQQQQQGVRHWRVATAPLCNIEISSNSFNDPSVNDPSILI
jgi:hypothetical protein